MSYENKISEIKNALNFWRSKGHQNIACLFYFFPMYPQEFFNQIGLLGIKTFFCMHEDEPQTKELSGITILNRTHLCSQTLSGIDLLLIADDFYDAVYHSIGTYEPTNRLLRQMSIKVVPTSKDLVVRRPIISQGIGQAANNGDVIAHYLMRSNLKGGYAEFGTWFGTSFYSNWLDYGDQLTGDWFAFDSFGGLPNTRENEKIWTESDWIQGRYWCNESSFLGNGELCGAPVEKIQVVDGFYSDTLDHHTISDYGIKEKSLSFVCVDCDLYDSTLSVLRFIEPALDDGAVIYFDDWLLARAGPEAGEYHAAQVWIKESGNKIDLVPLHKKYWAHQYVIFNRRWP